MTPAGQTVNMSPPPRRPMGPKRKPAPSVKPWDLDVRATAAATGVSAACLGAWARRYLWPIPIRGPSGGKYFSPTQVDLIRRVKARRDAGVPLCSILTEDGPILPPVTHHHFPVVLPVARCKTTGGYEAQTSVLKARTNGMPLDQIRDFAFILAVRVHPDDRAGVYACVPKD